MDTLDIKLNESYPGRVVRKDLLHQIKKGTNIPSFVLEFLLAKYCASDDPDEIDAGIAAVFETIQKNYVRPDEANKAQSMVQQKGQHKYIDKIHVKYVEREKRHWAEMENFNSRRIAIPEKFYRDNERLLAGGIWAEVTVGYNDVDEDDYAFYIEDLRPIQLSRFNADEFLAGREKFSRDEWVDVVLRSIGLEPSKLTLRLKFHFLTRLFSLVEANYNFIELGPRGTGKSYVFSEFSPYSTLVSGGQATTPILFYNNAKRQVGLVGYWDTVAFDEVGGIRIRDQSSIDILKDYMANGRFSRGFEVIANASMAFVGNIDHSIEQLVHSTQFDLFISLPESFDLAVMDRFHTYLPGWEMPKNSSEYLTINYGFITDYLAEAFHRVSRQTSRYEYVNRHCKFGNSVEGRDEVSVKKTVSALLKLIHPVGEPTREELVQYMEYALEGRRRVKEQMNKRKPDDEFAKINLSYFNEHEEEVIVWCVESKNAEATQRPTRKTLPGLIVRGEKNAKTPVEPKPEPVVAVKPEPVPAIDEKVAVTPEPLALGERHFKIFYDDVGHTYESLFGDYLRGAKIIDIEDSYIRSQHQIANFVRFCELVVKIGSTHTINLTTGFEDEAQRSDTEEKLQMLAASLIERGIKLNVSFNDHLHDREIRLDTGWKIKIGRGLDIYQRPDNWFSIGANDFELRPCLETIVDIFRDDSR
ncbi:MAG: BREX system Lon protease-like protein BrxL [Syntrophobacteraceae bacterium]